jgi:hypothetical protein
MTKMKIKNRRKNRMRAKMNLKIRMKNQILLLSKMIIKTLKE